MVGCGDKYLFKKNCHPIFLKIAIGCGDTFLFNEKWSSLSDYVMQLVEVTNTIIYAHIHIQTYLTI